MDPKTAQVEAKAAKARAKALRPVYKKKRFWVLLIIAIIVIANVVNAAKSPKSTSSDPTNGATTTQPQVTTTAAPVAPVVLWHESGSGQASGPQFTVPAGARQWEEQYSFNCSNFGQAGNFATSITGYGNAALTTDTGANQLSISGSAVDHYFDTGTFSIQVISECAWSIRVTSFG
jgi:hypothetical protein